MRGKRFYLVCLCAVLMTSGAFGQGLEFSGVLDSTVNTGAGAGRDFFWGIEEYVNLRMQAKLRNGAAFYGALNLIAVSGSVMESAAALGSLNHAAGTGLAGSAFTAGDNYAAAVEPERLYFRINGEYADWEAGLMRIAFGYGQVWGPSDFLNPRNPLFPDARPRAVLGTSLAAYPGDDVKVMAFAAAPKDPEQSGGGGFLSGVSADLHGERTSLQALYSFESPQGASSWGVHRGALSLKADLELGFAADLIYTLDPALDSGFNGLSASGGFDYSFFDGNFYVLMEYLYNGSDSASAWGPKNLTGLSRQNYLYGSILYRFNNYTNLSLANILCFDDGSFSPILALEHELLQGMTLSFRSQLPLDRDVFSGDGNQGELGPFNTGARFLFTAKARLRF